MRIRDSGMTVDQLINKCFWLLITVVVGWGVTRIDKMSESIDALNRNMAVVLSQIATHDRSINSLFEVQFTKRPNKREHKED